MQSSSDKKQRSRKEEKLKVALVYCPPENTRTGGPPYSLAVLSAFLKKQGHEVRSFDLNYPLYYHKAEYRLNRFMRFAFLPFRLRCSFAARKGYFGRVYKRWAKEIISESPDVIGFSIQDDNLPVSVRLATYLKEKYPDSRIIFGGYTQQKAFRQFVLDNGVADHVLVGEAESNLIELLEMLQSGEEPPSELFKDYSNSHVDYESLPVPDYSDFHMNNYERIFYDSSRGCVNRCSFCISSAIWKRYRAKSAEKVIKDLEYLASNYPGKKICIADSMINADKARLTEICDGMIKSKLKPIWYTMATSKDLPFEILKKMKKAGCIRISFGIESGSGKVLRDMGKPFDVDEASRTIRDAKNAGINVKCSFIVGHPSEGFQEFYDTIRFVYGNRKNIDVMDVFTLNILEGTSIYRDFLRKQGHPKSQSRWSKRRNNYIIRLLRRKLLKTEFALLKYFDRFRNAS